MNVLQLILFAWVGAWVLCESLFPTLSYQQKLFTCLLSAFVAGYANNAHGILWQKIKKIFLR